MSDQLGTPDAASIRAQQIAALAKHTPILATANIVNAGLTAIVFWGSASPYLLVCWAGLIIGFGVWRLHNWRRSEPRTTASARAPRRAVQLALALGLIWGGGVFLLFPQDQPGLQIFLTIVVAGMSAGAAMTLASIPAAAIAFILAIQTPLIARFVVIGDYTGLAIAGMMAMFAIVTIFTVRTVYQAFVENTQSTHANAELLRQLDGARAELLDLAQSSEAFALFDGEDRLQLWNRNFKDFLSLPDDALRRGKRYRDLLAAIAPAREIVEGKRTLADWIDEQCRRHDQGTGVAVLHLSNGRSLRVSDQRTASGGTISVWVDVTELEQQAALLQASEQQLRVITNSLPVLIAYLDTEQRYRFVNDTAERWFRRSTEEILGCKLDQVLGERAYEIVRPHVEAALSGETTKFERTMEYPDGIERIVELTYVPDIAADRHVRGFFGLVVDVTEQRKAEEQLRQAQKMEAVGQLTGGVAHDFNNLLSVIIGNLDYLDEKLRDEEPHRHVGPALHAALRGAELTHRLLAFSRKQALKPVVSDVNALISGMTGLLTRTLGETIEIETTLAADLWKIEVDQTQFETALLNLAVNARHAIGSGGGGKLAIETANIEFDAAYATQNDDVEAGAYVMVAIGDSGAGMSADVLTQAFEPFFTTKQVGEGSGLGLSMVYGFVKQSGGHAKLQSAVGLGTTVRLYFPRTAEIAEAPAPTSPPDGDGQMECILVVEDDGSLRAVAEAILSGLGYRILSAATGKAALAALDETPEIDLLFTDVVLAGGMSGVELAKRARERRPALKVLFVSGHTASAIAFVEDLKDGVAFLPKPYRKALVADTLRQLFDDTGA